MELSEFKKLLKINDEWYKQFRGELLIENILEKYEDIGDFIKLVTDKWIKCWFNNTKNKEIKNLYLDFKTKILHLDMNLLKSEYKLVHELYKYSKELVGDDTEDNYDGSTNDLKSIIKWIEGIEDSNNLDDIKYALEDRVRYN